MGTRAIIGHIQSDSLTRYIYTTSDGYLSHTGETLLTHHNSERAARSIVSLGTIASIQESLGDRPLRMTETQYWLDSYEDPELRRNTYAYHRDRAGVDWHTVPDSQVIAGYTREQLMEMDTIDELCVYEISGALRGFSERMLSLRGRNGDKPEYAYLYVGEKVHSERMYRDTRARKQNRPSSAFSEPQDRFSDTIPPHTRIRGEIRPPPPNLLSDAEYELMEKLATPWSERGGAPRNLFDYATGVA